jgi:hypothetical protein
MPLYSFKYKYLQQYGPHCPAFPSLLRPSLSRPRPPQDIVCPGHAHVVHSLPTGAGSSSGSSAWHGRWRGPSALPGVPTRGARGLATRGGLQPSHRSPLKPCWVASGTSLSDPRRPNGSRYVRTPGKFTSCAAARRARSRPTARVVPTLLESSWPTTLETPAPTRKSRLRRTERN